MARITVEDCLTRENNRFALVQLASKRTKQLLRGSPVKLDVPCDNKAVVTALREIAEGNVRFLSPEELAKVREDEARRAREAEAQAAFAPPPPTPGPALPIAPAPIVGGEDDGEGEGEKHAENGTPL